MGEEAEAPPDAATAVEALAVLRAGADRDGRWRPVAPRAWLRAAVAGAGRRATGGGGVGGRGPGLVALATSAIAMVVAVAVAVGAGALWWRSADDGSSPVHLPMTRPGPRGTAPGGGAPGGAAESGGTDTGPVVVAPTGTDRRSVWVHAAGAVVRPGVVVVPDGARVADVLVVAGGAAVDADLDRLNLAAPVDDGARVYVPRRGEADPPVAVLPSGPSRPTDTRGGGDRATTAGPVDLNRATAEQLEALPGIGPATARAIVAHRQAHGPFTSVDGLLAVRGIGPAKLDQLRPLVTV